MDHREMKAGTPKVGPPKAGTPKIDQPKIGRRALTLGLGTLGLGALGLGSALAALSPGSFMGGSFIGGVALAAESEIDLEAALAPRFLGNPDAKATMAEYFSMTCPHCARYRTEVYPEVKKKYVDSGLLRMEARDYPLDQWALQAAALARCVPERHYHSMLDILMEQQATWTRAPDIGEALIQIGRLAGLSPDRARACMANDDLLNGILAIRLEGQEKYDINATPSFVLNGERISAHTFEEFDAILSEAVN